MLETIIGLSAGILLLSFLGYRVGKGKDGLEKSIFSVLGEIALYCFAGLLFLIMIFLLNEFNSSESWSGVISSIFVVLQILFGLLFGVGAAVASLLLIVLGVGKAFGKKEEKKRKGYYFR